MLSKQVTTTIPTKWGTFQMVAYAESEEVYSTGQSVAELKKNMCEALELAHEDDSVVVLPEQLRIRIDLTQFFAYYKVLNARFLAAHIGMNPTLLSQYVQGKKKPSIRQTERIIEGIHKLACFIVRQTLRSGCVVMLVPYVCDGAHHVGKWRCHGSFQPRGYA